MSKPNKIKATQAPASPSIYFDESAREKAKEAKIVRHDVSAVFDAARLHVSAKDAERIKTRLAQMPVSFRLRYLKALRGRSLTTAIHAFCHECVGWVSSDAHACTSPECPLYPYRPTQD